MQETIKSVLDGYADAQCNLASNEARALLAKDINDALVLRENIALAKDERQRWCIDAREMERHRGLEIGPDGTVTEVK